MKSIILQRILPELKIIGQAANTNHIKFFDQIKVSVLEKKEVIYVTDGAIIVQLIKLQENNPVIRDDFPKPFNRIRTKFYNFNTKHVHLFRFNEDHCSDDTPEFPSAYQPQFHFQDRLPVYKENADKFHFNDATQVLLIKQWGFRIVNIANSGYYGIILEVYNYLQLKEKYVISPDAHSILFDKQLAFILESLRVNDMRKQIGSPNKPNPISLCYYRKNIKNTHINKTMLSNFVTVDRQGRVFKVNSHLKQYYLALGNIVGVLRFIRPLTNFYETKKMTINFNLVQSLPEKNTSEPIQTVDVWQSSEDQNVTQIEAQNQHFQQDEDLDEQQQQEDPLKLIYLKQLEKNKQII